jgi:cytochrome b6-f complex iron-sulfur subunit
MNHKFITQSQFSRRELLIWAGSLGLLAALGGIVRVTLRFLTPPISQARPSRLVAGPPSDFPVGALAPLTTAPVFIGRDEAGLYALSAVCTHLGCTVAQRVEALVCPCHGSHFSRDGVNVAGPALQPLPHLALTFNDAGLVEVN